MIRPYPVHRQTLPASSSRISVSVGSPVRSSRSWTAMISPGVQNPHCTAPASTKAAWTSDGDPNGAMPSIVTIGWPTAAAAITRHEHTNTPSSMTLHEPHSPCSQAPLVPINPSRSRSTSSRLSPSHESVTSRAAPLTSRCSGRCRGSCRHHHAVAPRAGTIMLPPGSTRPGVRVVERVRRPHGVDTPPSNDGP